MRGSNIRIMTAVTDRDPASSGIDNNILIPLALPPIVIVE